VRIPIGRWIMGLFVLFAARGCYSSVAPVAKIDPGEDDAGVSVQPAPTDACAPRRPWEGPGVTGLLPIDSSNALILSGDRYFTVSVQTAGVASDPSLGRVLAWREAGLLEKLWAGAPQVVGRRPWDEPGVTAAYLAKGTSSRQIIISGFRRWVHEGDQWVAAGSVVDDWRINDAGPPEVDGQVPWEGVGVTGAYFVPGGAFFYAISQGNGWQRRTADPDPKNWTWSPEGGANLASSAPWSTAPQVGGQRPHEGTGVTAAYYVGARFFVVSVDKMWVHDGAAWVASGLLKDMPGWTSAPTAGCDP
jgi:hypothetical protein